MSEISRVEAGSMGRIAYARILPNEDLVQAVERLCLLESFRCAFVRGALGSLVDACMLNRDGSYRFVRGPAVEIVSLAGEVRSLPDGSINAALSGVVAGTDGVVHGGVFVPGMNTICMTLEITLEEWLPKPESAEST